MKNTLLGLFVIAALVGCGKSDNSGGGGTPASAPIPAPAAPVVVGPTGLGPTGGANIALVANLTLSNTTVFKQFLENDTRMCASSLWREFQTGVPDCGNFASGAAIQMIVPSLSLTANQLFSMNFAAYGYSSSIQTALPVYYSVTNNNQGFQISESPTAGSPGMPGSQQFGFLQIIGNQPLTQIVNTGVAVTVQYKGQIIATGTLRATTTGF